MNGPTKSLTHLVGIALLASPLAVLGAPTLVNKCNTTIGLTSSPTPVIEGDTLTIAEDVTVASVVTGNGSNACTLGVGSHVNDGTLEIYQVRAGSIGVSCGLLTSPPSKVCTAGDLAKIGTSTCTANADCDSLAGGDGVCSPVKTAGNSLAKQPDPPGVPAVSGTLSVGIGTTGLGGSTLGFLGSYKGSATAGINDAAQVCFDVPIEQKDAIACDSGALISIKRAAGPGAPLPGTTNNWQYEVTVEACEHLDDVTAQGGTNGWAPLTNRLDSTQSGSALHPSVGSAAVRNANKKNEAILWTIGAMEFGDTTTLTVDLSGSIPPKTPDCQLRYLSGPWSAIYKADGLTLKSDYTGRVFLFVTLDGDSSDCVAP
jgi:hypothetical protein